MADGRFPGKNLGLHGASATNAVMPGLVPGIHAAMQRETSGIESRVLAWMAGTSPAMTFVGRKAVLSGGIRALPLPAALRR